MSYACGDKKNPVNNSGPDTGGPVQTVFQKFSNQYLDLDSGLIDSVSIIPGASADVSILFNAGRAVHSVLFNESGSAISRLVGEVFSEVTVAQADTATFLGRLDVPFDSTNTFLIKTNLGSVYKLGNASETSTGATFDYALMSVAP